MKDRDLKKNFETQFDVVVIGGGAHGATSAYHLAKAGYKTALVDQGDFCSKTSANSLKIIHGGLRYLQHGNIKRMRHSIRSRREMMQVAPHLTTPLPCIMPTKGAGIKGRLAMRTALFLNDCISWDRNQDIESSRSLPTGSTVSKETCVNIIPGLSGTDVTGGAVWYDAMAHDTERLLIEYILKSTEYGGVAVNYCKAVGIDKTNDGSYRITVKDQLSEEKYQIRTSGIVNAAGPCFERLMQNFTSAPPRQKWSLALNIISKKQLFKDYAVALEGVAEYQDKDALLSRGKRLYFFVPWRGHTMIGTEYELHGESPEKIHVKRSQIEKMVDGVNSIYPAAELSFADISFYHAGLMPVQDSSTTESIQLEKNSTLMDHSENGFENVVSIRGVKYTTAPYIAWHLVEYFQGKIGNPREESPKRSHTFDTEFSSIRFEYLRQRYGARASLVESYLTAEDRNGDGNSEDCQLSDGELRYLVEHEMVCKLTDIVFRRTGIGTADYPGRPLLYTIAQRLAQLLHWKEERIRQEVEEVVDRYRPLAI